MARESMPAAMPSVGTAAAVRDVRFPRYAVGLDSWANVHLTHEKGPHQPGDFPDSLSLAHGQCSCRREVGRKGVPRCFVPWDSEGDNIDLFPEGYL